MKKIKVFIVEDSILMQKIIEDILSSDPQIEVIGTTKLGKEALIKIPQLQPDIVTLDINLPDISGIDVLKELMNVCPVRVIMLSAYTQKGAEMTMRTLELGALDFVPKPSGEVSLDLYNFRDEIVNKVKVVAGIELKKFFPTVTISRPPISSVDKLVIIGASTGGPQAILKIMSLIQPNPQASFLIVQHMPMGFTKSFSERICWCSSIKTKEAEDGDVIVRNCAFVAPSGFHMIVEKSPANVGDYCIRLDETPLVNYVRPAVDVTMESAVQAFSGQIVGVILSGMGKDGMEGARKIKARGGKIIAQDENSCVIYGMPKAIVDNGLADVIVPLEGIAQKISEYLKL
jgi:two-component system chemotaxis response regulator CheB